MRLTTRLLLPSLVLAALPGAAYAQGFQIAGEFEYLKYSDTGISNQAFSVIPGWRFPDDRFLSRVELLLEGNQDSRAVPGGVRFTENKAFLRLRHSGDVTDKLGYYVRGGLGHSWNNERNFNYGYVEPALEYSFHEHLDGVIGYRQTNAVDGTPGQRLGEIRAGPDWNISAHHSLEFRYVRGHGDVRETTWVLEYVYRP
jgi:hypothetical protein